MSRKALLKVVILVILSFLVSITACSTSSSTGEETFAQPTQTAEQRITSEPTTSSTPILTLTPILATIMEQTTFSNPDVSLSTNPQWVLERLEDGLRFSDPDDSSVWMSVSLIDTDYVLSVVDERVSEELLEELAAVDPEISFTALYPAALGSITYGRAGDYIYTLGGRRINGGFTVGTNNFSETWLIRWEAPSDIYPEVLVEFLTVLNSFTPLTQ